MCLPCVPRGPSTMRNCFMGYGTDHMGEATTDSHVPPTAFPREPSNPARFSSSQPFPALCSGGNFPRATPGARQALTGTGEQEFGCLRLAEHQQGRQEHLRSGFACNRSIRWCSKQKMNDSLGFQLETSHYCGILCQIASARKES